jgi:hypothetical protein
MANLSLNELRRSSISSVLLTRWCERETPEKCELPTKQFNENELQIWKDWAKDLHIHLLKGVSIHGHHRRVRIIIKGIGHDASSDECMCAVLEGGLGLCTGDVCSLITLGFLVEGRAGLKAE